jgi:hypothetical protein
VGLFTFIGPIGSLSNARTHAHTHTWCNIFQFGIVYPVCILLPSEQNFFKKYTYDYIKTFNLPKTNRCWDKRKFRYNGPGMYVHGHHMWNCFMCFKDLSGIAKSCVCACVRVCARAHACMFVWVCVCVCDNYRLWIHANFHPYSSRIHMATVCTSHWGPESSQHCMCKCWVLYSCHLCSHPDTPARRSSHVVWSRCCIYMCCLLWKNIIYITAPYLLIPYSRALLEKLTGLQLVKNFPAFYGNRKFITTIKCARNLSLSWATSIQSMPPHLTSWRFILIVSCHLCLGLPSDLFPWDLPTKNLHTSILCLYVLHAPPISFFSILLPEQYWVSSTDH